MQPTSQPPTKRRPAWRAALLAVLVCAGGVAAAPSNAAQFNGNYLLRLCEIGDNGKEVVKGGHAACQAYIAGVIDYHLILQSAKIAPEMNICVPGNVTMNRLHAIVLKYLQENVQHDGFVAAPAVTTALYQAYPCR